MSQSCGINAQVRRYCAHGLNSTLPWGQNKMNKMIRTGMMAAAMFFAVTTVAKAQDAAAQQGGRRGGGGGAGRITAVLKDSMKVSDAIVAKADSIQKSY